MIDSSSNILFKDNIIFGFVKFGLNINSANNITVDGSIIVDIRSRAFTALDAIVDVGGGLISCAYRNPDVCT